EPATSAEEVDGFLGSKWGDRVLDFSGDAEEFARGAEERQVGAGPQELGERGRRLDHLLYVVEQEEQLALCDVGGETVLGSERLGDGLRDERGIAQVGEPYPKTPAL